MELPSVTGLDGVLVVALAGPGDGDLEWVNVLGFLQAS